MNRTSRWSEPVRSVLAKCFSGRAAGVRLLLIFLCALFAAQATPGGYSYYRPITIDHTKVPYLDQTKFPVFLSVTDPTLKSVANGGHVLSANGYDIIFSSDAGGATLLSYERESYNAATGQLICWVRLPVVSSSADTVFYVWYGNTTITTDQSNRTGTWNSGFLGVWHFPNGTTLSANDSTANASNGTISGPVAATGQIDGGVAIGAGANYIGLGTPSSFNFGYGSPVTVSAWVYLNSIPTSEYTVISCSGTWNGFALKFDPYGTNASPGFAVNNGYTYGYHAVPIHQWTYVVATLATGAVSFYINGINVAVGSAISLNQTNNPVYIGNNASGTNGFDGILDELRVSNVARSAQWIAAEYSNQSSPSTFYSVGSETATGAGAPSIAGLSPALGAQGSIVPVTLTGTNFVTGATVNPGNGGITVSGVTVVSATQITATFTISGTALTGANNVTVTTNNGMSNGVPFTVTPPAPTLTTVSPNSGAQGTSVPVTLTGTNFVTGATVNPGNSGITVSGVTVASSTQITATFTIVSTAATGTNNITVTTTGGTSGGQPFTVKPPAPTLTTVSPNSGAQGGSVSVTLTGTNFVTGATAVNPGNSGITVSGVTVVSATQITATFTISGTSATGANNVTVTTNGGTSNGVPFTVNPPAPTLTTVSPNSGAQGTAVSVTLTGTNFVTGATTVSPGNSGITVSNVTVVSGTQITATFTISGTAATGANNVTVTTAGGTSNGVPFTVNLPPAPTLTSVSPNSGEQGTAVPVTLTGTNFVSGATVSPGNSGITVSGVTVVNATQITATLTISGTAATGTNNMTVTTAGGTGNGVPFTVNPPAPTLTAVSPNSGTQGATLSVTLTGANFATGATVSPGNSGITVSNVTVASATQITATFTISGTAATGINNVTVTTAGGTSNGVPFTVTPPAPTLTTVSPNSGAQGTAVSVTLTGTNFVSGTTVNPGSSGITVSNLTVVSATQITATFTISGTAATGASSVTATTAGGTSNGVPFTVTPPAPTLTTVSPNSGAQGTAVAVTLTGTSFVSGATVNPGSSGITVSNVTVSSATQITATFTISGTAATGANNVTVTTNGGTSNGVSFTVNPPAPTLTAASPNSGAQGATVPVTVTGTNFVTGATVSPGNSGITVSGLTVVSSTQITATFTISGTAATGANNVTVTTSGGTSNGVPFTVNPPAPTLTTLSPNSGAQGTAVSVTLAGTNFVTGATTVNPGNSGITVSGVTVVSATQITATFAVSTTAATGANNVTVTTSGGTSNGVPFTVNPPVPGGLNTSDSTANGNSGAAYNGAAAVSGWIGDGAAFNGSNEYVGLGAVGTLMPTGATTASAWIKASSTQASSPAIVSAGDATGATGYNLYFASQGYPAFTVKEGANSWGSCHIQGPTLLNDNSWHLVTGVYTGASIGIYVDGVLAGSSSCANQSINYGSAPASEIGWRLDAGNNDAFNGALDEVRVSSAGRSADWIATEFNNQSAPAAFYAVGTTQAMGVQAPYSIGGQVSTQAAVPLTGVTMTLTGASGGTTTTNSGAYEFGGLIAGNYTVTPSMPSCATFTAQGSSSITLPSSQSGSVNFTATGTCTISGQITLAGAGLSGVTVTLSGGPGGTTIPPAVTGANGQYTFTGLFASSYTITPSLAGYTFSGNTSVTAPNTAANFAATVTTYTISGQITDYYYPTQGVGGASVNLVGGPWTAGSPLQATTNPDGFYSFTGLPVATYTITPQGAAGAFNPPSIPVTLPSSQAISENFVEGNPLAITPGSLTAATVGVHYQQQFSASGGTGSYTWSLASGTLPAGLTFSPSGLLSGTPTAAGTANFTVQVTDTGSNSLTASLSLTVIAPPTLTTVSPNNGAQGTAVSVTLTGTGFVTGATAVNPGNTGITVSGVTVVSTTQITATFTIAGTAATGASSVTVTTSGGTSSAVPFTVNPPPPTLTTVSPNSGAQGAPVTVTLNGTNFVTGATTVNPGNAGITVSGVTVVSTTQITATFTISGTAATGTNNVTVTTAGGTSNGVPFTVTAATSAPTLTTVTPNSGAQGTPVTVTLAGTNFVTGATTVNPGNTGITVSGVTVVSTTQITATFTISGTAATGTNNVMVTTASGTSDGVPFTVTAATSAPTLATVTPNSGAQGAPVTVTLNGTNFVTGATTVNPGNTGITVSGVTVVSTTQITATFTILVSASTGTNNVTVTTASGTSNGVPFTVTAASTVTISAQVMVNGSPARGITLTLGGDQSTSGNTDATGSYIFTVPAGGHYTVTPSMSGYMFCPGVATVAAPSTNQTVSFTSSGLGGPSREYIRLGGRVIAIANCGSQ